MTASYSRLGPSGNTAYEIRLLDKPIVCQSPLRLWVRELEMEVAQELWDKFRHL